MSLLQPALSSGYVPLFLWETILNCTCLRLYTDGSQFSADLVAEVLLRVPVVLYSKADENTRFFHTCNVVAVAEDVADFKPPVLTSFINILITAEPSNATALLNRYTRKIFFWISVNGSSTEIRSFHSSGRLGVTSVDKFKGLIKPLLSNHFYLPDFKGKKFYITAANHSVYSLVRTRNSEIEWIAGFEYDTLDFVCDILNLTKIVRAAEDAGSFDDENATGVIADVIHDRTDVGIGGIWFNGQLSSRVGYLPPYDMRCGHYLVPRPKNVLEDSLLVPMPFEANLWFSVGFAVIVGSCMTTVFARFFDVGYAGRYASFKWSLYSSVMHLILRYYPNEFENRGVMRPLFVSWSWLSFVLATVYTSQLAAIYVTPRYEDKPQTVVDFYKKGFYWGGPSSQPPHLYQVTFSPVFGPLWRKERFIPENSVDDRNARMEKGNYVIRGESVDDYFFFNDDHMPREDIVKKYEAAGECYAVFYTAPIFPLGSPYTKLFSRVVSLMRSFGIKKMRKKILFSHKPVKDFIPRNVFSFTTSNKTKEFCPVNLTLVSSPFILLVIGQSIAVLLFLFNRFCYKGKLSSVMMRAARRGRTDGGPAKANLVGRFPYNN